MRAFGVDLDGVVWVGANPLLEVAHAIELLRRRGPVLFLTNNSAKTKESLQKKLAGMGIHADVNQIRTSSDVAMGKCAAEGWRQIFVIATQEIKSEYSARGFELVEVGAEAVIIHFTTEFDYKMLFKASANLLSGAAFLACNRDRLFPVEGGVLQPGAGPSVAAIEYATRREPFICGKPEAHYLQDLITNLGIAPDEFTMIGDSMESDILMGKKVGTNTVLIQSATGEINSVAGVKPDFTFGSLIDFAKSLG